MNQNNELTLRDVLLLIKKKLPFLILVTVIFGVASYFGSRYLLVPRYESTATLIVNINPDKESSYNDVAFSQKLVDIYSVILKNQTLLNRVVNDLKIPVNPASLANNITINNVDSTGILQISVQDTDPERAKAITDKIVELAPGEINRTVKAGSVELISPAQNARYVWPDNKKNMTIGMSSGLLLSLIIIFLLEMLNNKFKTKEDINARIGYPVLGAVPYFFKIDRQYRKGTNISPGKNSFQITESFNTILANLKYMTIDKPIKKILVTSSIPGEGKSLVSLNLARSLAKLEKKVLLLDLDLRKSDTKKFMKLANARFKGVSSVLTHTCMLSDAIIHSGDGEIDILPSGPIPPNPSALLQSNAMRVLFAELEKVYDYIVVDTPPVSIFSDATALLSLTDGIIFVIRQKYTTFEAARNSKNQFDCVNANILGCVFNSFRYKNDYKFNSYYRNYRHHT